MKKKQTSRRVKISSSGSSSGTHGSGTSRSAAARSAKKTVKKSAAPSLQNRRIEPLSSFHTPSPQSSSHQSNFSPKPDFEYSQKKPSLQKPLLLTVLCLLVIVSFAAALSFVDEAQKKQLDQETASMTNLRKGQQIASVTILPVGGSMESTEASGSGNNAGGTAAAGGNSAALPSISASTAAVTAAATSVSGAVPAGERVRFAINQFRLLALQPLKFNLFDEQGNELSPDLLQSIQGEKVHLFLAHANLREFQHLIPVYQNGSWNLSANMPTPGTYSAYITFSPLRGKQVALKYDLIVREGSPSDIALPSPTNGLTVSEGIIKVAMQMQRTDYGRIFSFTATSGDRPITVEPYLETLSQLTLFKHGDPTSFTTLGADPFSNENQGLVSFASKALSAGRWTAFAEIKTQGRVYIFPFTFDIGTM